MPASAAPRAPWALHPDQRVEQVAVVTGVIGSGSKEGSAGPRGTWVVHSQASWCSLLHGDCDQMTCSILQPRGLGPSARSASPPHRGDG